MEFPVLSIIQNTIVVILSVAPCLLGENSTYSTSSSKWEDYSASSSTYSAQCIDQSCPEYGELSMLKQKEDSFETRLGNFSEKLEELEEEHDSFIKSTEGFKAGMEQLRKDIEAEANKLVEVQDAIGGILGSIEDIRQYLEKNTKDIQRLDTKLTHFEARIENVEELLTKTQTEFGLLEDRVEDLEQKTAMKFTEKVTSAQNYTLKIPANTCDWVEVNVDIATSANNADSYAVLFLNGSPIEGSAECSFESEAAVGFQHKAGGTASKQFVVTDIRNKNTTLKLDHCYTQADHVSMQMTVICFA